MLFFVGVSIHAHMIKVCVSFSLLVTRNVFTYHFKFYHDDIPLHNNEWIVLFLHIPGGSDNIYGLVQDCSISIAKTLDVPQS